MRKRVLMGSKLCARNTVNGCTPRRVWNFSERSRPRTKRLEIESRFPGIYLQRPEATALDEDVGRLGGASVL